jgi:uncharacterized protein YdaU (DUF1376 family)
MNNANHWFPFFWNDYLNDTLQLTMLQHGAYFGCLLACYRSGVGLPSDLSTIFRIVGAFTTDEQTAVGFVLEKFFKKRDDNSYFHSRVDCELKKIAEKRASAKAAIAARWEKEKRTAVHSHEHTDEDTDVSDPNVRNRYKHNNNNNREEGANSENDDQAVVAVVSLLEEQHLADIGPWGDRHRPQMKSWIKQHGQAFMNEAITKAKAEGFDASVKSRIAIMVTTFLPKAIAQLVAERERAAQQKKQDEFQAASIERQTLEIIARRDRPSPVAEATFDDFMEDELEVRK